MSIIRLCTPLSVLMFVGAAHAEVNCDKVSNYKDVIECAEARSPEVAKAEGSLKEKAARVDAAAQFANPSISLSSVSGTIDSDRKVETDVALSFPIELGGKRAARKKVASVEEARAQWNLYRTKAEVRKEVAIKLLRIKQIERELGLVDESVSAFTKLVKQYEGRPARSPEQDVSLTVFKIAKSEYDLKKTEYDEELLTLESYFLITTGLGLKDLKAVSLPAVSTWPTPADRNENLKASPMYISAEYDVQAAQGEFDKEAGDSWPTMNIGPSAKMTRDSGRDFQQYGFNLSMPIPVFNANGAGRAAARAAVLTAEQRRNIALKQLEAERALYKTTYTRAVASLKDTPSGRVLEDKHKKIENLFLKGVVPSSLVIEAHRSLVDFEKARNDHELKALGALFNIQLIDGQPVGVNP